MFQCVIAANSREALSSGDVELPGSTLFSYGLDFDKIKIPQEEGKKHYATLMKSLRQAKYIPTREQFAKGVLANLQIIPVNGDVERVADALDAAYHYQRFLLSDVNPDYDYLEHASDWVDRQLLYYLAAPNMNIVTNDRNVKYRCRESKQSERVLVI